MKVYQRNGTWYIYFRRHGRRYRESAGPGSTKKDADRLLAERLREVDRARIYGERHPDFNPFFGDFAADFLKRIAADRKSVVREAEILEMLKLQWAGKRLAEISTEMIEDYKARRLKTRAKATVKKELQVIKSLFKKAVVWGRIPASPAEQITHPKVKNNRVRYLEPDEMTRLMNRLPAWLHEIALLALATGARRGEILGLRWRDVDFKRGLIVFRDTKNGEDGTVAMNQTVRNLLAELPPPFNKNQLVFRDARTAGAIKIEKLRKAWLTACRAAQIGESCACIERSGERRPAKRCRYCAGSGIIPDFHFHDLRHQAATELITAGASLNDVRDFLRHKTANMTLRYAHLVKDRRTATAALLDRRFLSPKTATGESGKSVTP